jgi:putative hemolysin
MITIIILIAVFAILTLLLFWLVSAENTVFALSADDIRILSLREDMGSRWITKRLKKPRDLSLFFVLARTLLITVAAIDLFIFIGIASGWLLILICGLLFWTTLILFGFAFPGGFVRGNKIDKTIRWVPFIRFSAIILHPLTFLWKSALRVLAPKGGLGGPLAIERELNSIIFSKEGFTSLETEEKEMIRHVVEFGDTMVREVMVPRIDMVCVPVGMTLDEAVKVIARAGHSRIPVYRSRVDNIVGVLYAKDLLIAVAEPELNKSLKDITREPYFVPEAKRIADLLDEFRKERIHIAIVVDEYGGTAGLVTLEDLIEEIVGEIHDEYDIEEAPIRRLSNNVFLVDAKLPIGEINEELGIALPEEDSDTLGGLIYTLAGAIPNPGDRFEYKNVLFIVESVVGQRVKDVKIVIKNPDE